VSGNEVFQQVLNSFSPKRVNGSVSFPWNIRVGAELLEGLC